MVFSFEQSSFKDPDTGVYNLNYFMEVLFREWHRLMREQDKLSLVIVHPLYPKSEHQAERKAVASILGDSTYRSTDIVSKFNEDDFLLGLFNLNSEGTSIILQRIIEQAQTLKNNFGVEVWASAINVCPNNQINVQEVFDQLQLQMQDPELRSDKHFKIEEFTLH